MSTVSYALLSEQQAMIRESARRVAQEVVAPTAAQRDQASQWPRAEIEAAAGAGFMGMLIPEEYGGSGLSFVEYCLALEEFAAADGGFTTIMHVHNSCGLVLRAFGTEAQKRHYLPQIASARSIGAFLLSEPQAGSDTAAFRATARREGDHYVLNGTKQWISNGSEAGVALVIAATGEPGSRERFSLFIVDPAAPGYKVLRVEDKLGQRTAHTAQIQLDELRVPADNLVGEEGRGYSKVLGLLSDGRVAIAALAVGIARAALEAALRYAQEREAYGQPISALQAIRFDLAEMAMQVDVARQYSLHAARLIDAGIPAARESAMAKLFASEMAETVCSQALQVHGGYGYVKDFPVERYYRDVRVTKIYEGTSHIQKHIIARSLLGGGGGHAFGESLRVCGGRARPPRFPNSNNDPSMSTTAAGRAASKTPRRAAPKPKWNNAVDSRDEQYQLKKKAVILEAARAFGRRGAANVSLDEIAAALNVTKPALYYYFKNKQDLIYECHELTMQVGDEALQKAIESERTGYARIAAFIRIYVPALTGELGAPALLRSDSALTPAQVKRTRERRRQFDLRLRGLVEDGIRDGTILPCDSKFAVNWFMGAVASIPDWFDNQGERTGEQIAEIFVSFLARGIQRA